MTDNVIQFGDFAFRSKAKRFGWEKDRCAHKRLELDDNGDMVMCLDCKQQVSAYWALRHITEQWKEHAAKLKRQADDLQQRLEKNVTLLAAQRVEKAWRSHKMVPTCPHCRAAIFPTDGFGDCTTSKEFELRRRSVGKGESR